MDPLSFTFQAFKNTLYNVIGFLWPMLFTLFITPLIVFKLGVKEYGIYLFINTLVGLIALIDLGLGNALTKHLSFYYGKKNEQAISALLHTANSLFLIIGSLGFAITLFISFGSIHFLPASFKAYQQYSFLICISGANFFFTSIASSANATFVALQRFDWSNKIGMLFSALGSLGLLAVVMLGGSLLGMFLVQLALSIILCLVSFYYARKLLPYVTIELGWDKYEVLRCYKFGLVNFVNNIAATALASLDRLIIPFFVGPSNLTYYSIPGNVSIKIPGFAGVISTSLFPTVSQLSGNDDMTRIRTLYIRSFRLITIIAGALTLLCISFSHQILFYWLNADFAQKSSHILIVLAMTNFVLALFGPLSSFLLGLGKLKFLTFSSIGMAILNIILLLILLPLYGIIGAAYAYFFSVLPVLYFFYYVERYYLSLSERRKYYKKTAAGLLSVSIIVFFLNLALGQFITSLFTLIVVGGTSGLIYVLLYRFLGFFADEDWQDMEHFYRLSLKRLKIIK